MEIKQFFKTVISCVYPNTCLNCGEIIAEGEFFCDYCFEMLARINHDKQCIKCGLDKKDCGCKNKIYSFDAITAPFYNRGSAQSAVYTYKFQKRQYISRFLAEQMSLAAKYVFYGIEFDGICYVPLSGKSLRKRGFDQSLEIARRMSRILGIPLIENQLVCRNKKKSQHKVPLKMREKNVKDVYFSTRPISGKILLVDDIKTTGATLNECSKQLLSSGAKAVYCITALITEKDRKE